MSLHLPFRAAARVLMAGLVAALAAPPAAAQTERVYFPAFENVTNVLVQRINAETQRIDMSAWYLTENAIVQALINRHNAGVDIRLIGDRGSIFEIDVHTKNAFYRLAAAGVPIRLRYNPTWFPEIAHWKATIFAGQGIVAFGSANYTPFELAPASSTNYKDETVLFTNDVELVRAFKTKFDRFWNDTTTEPESRIGGPPYFRNWDSACSAESACSDYRTQFPNPAPMIIDTRRLEPDYAMPADMVWGQGPSFNNRLVQEINGEFTRVDFVIYRLTVNNITQALLSKHQQGVPVRLIIEPNEYLNRKWPEFWLTHANIDKLWAAGVPVKWRTHDGLTHMKMLVTSEYATNASSNFAANWQRDHNYFVPAATKPAVYGAMRDRFNQMWNNTAGFANFVPQPPDAAGLASPANGATGVSTSARLTWNIAAFATSYDVYIGTSSSNMTLAGNVPAQLVDNPPTTYSFTASLQAGTTYFWQVVSRTNATPRNPSLIARSATRSLTTSGTAAPPPSSSLPSPWVSQDIGAVGAAGSASLLNGVYTVRGAGADIWGTADAFHFAHRSLSGDGQVVARVTGMQNTHTYAKAGIMLRGGTSAGAAHVILDLRPNGAVEFMTRSSAGGSTTWIGSVTQPAPVWLRLQRSGNTVTAAVSSNGSTWNTIGSQSVTLPSTVNAGLAVTSHVTGTLNASTFDNVSVSAGSTPPPPPPSAPDIVVYASDIPASALHGAWSSGADSTAPNGVKLLTTDAGFIAANQPLSSPADYVDVNVNVQAGVPYRIWLRLKALNNLKSNDAVWVQFSNARANGSQVYPMNSTSGLLVNLATDGTASSLNNWGWVNGAYWLSQATAVTFPTAGTQTIRIQVREDGVQLDQIVLSPSRFFNAPPGGPTNDTTIVSK